MADKEPPPAGLVRPAILHGKLAASSDVADTITLRNLHVTVKAGTDAWGREKPQPALITVTISLAKPFDSAAKEDAVDGSTVHYGKLSKRIISDVEHLDHHLSTPALARTIMHSVAQTAGSTDLKAVEIDIFYPKGSLLGDGAGYTYSVFGDYLSEVIYLRNVRIPCLIGVNANERERQQPVVVNLWLESLPHKNGLLPDVEHEMVEVRSPFHCSIALPADLDIGIQGLGISDSGISCHGGYRDLAKDSSRSGAFWVIY
jgi:dihydroneopterin aldolase